MKYLSSYNEVGLYSNKELMFNNDIMYYSSYLIPLSIYTFYETIYKYSKNMKTIHLITTIIISLLLSDLNSAIIHCYFSDRSFYNNELIIEDDYLIVDTNSGYSSNHHMFPSNWKDVSDITILSSILPLSIIPLILISSYIKSNALGLILTINLGMITMIPIIHKYCHEKHHNRYVPPILDYFYDIKLFLQPKNHSKHHYENTYNWALINGISDSILNSFVKLKCYLFDVCPDEEVLKNCRRYLEIYNTDIIKIKFVGDINGKLNVKLHGNLFYEA
jgi:hypothetical protein